MDILIVYGYIVIVLFITLIEVIKKKNSLHHKYTFVFLEKLSTSVSPAAVMQKALYNQFFQLSFFRDYLIL